jgi:hypothetical protein
VCNGTFWCQYTFWRHWDNQLDLSSSDMSSKIDPKNVIMVSLEEAAGGGYPKGNDGDRVSPGPSLTWHRLEDKGTPRVR